MLTSREIKVLIVCSGNSGYASPFIIEQATSLLELGVVIDFFLIKGKGIFGYLKNYSKYKKKIAEFKPNLVHAHYGLSGMFAVLQRKIPVITTYHGNDINPVNKIGHSKIEKINFFTKIALKLSAHNIFVSDELFEISKSQKKSSVISCGVNMNIFYERPKMEAKRIMNLREDKKYVLFSSAFNNEVKNYLLAKTAFQLISNVELIEMKGYKRQEVAQLLAAVDVQLVTSNNESGPLVIKEAMACNCPIVSTDVGDVKWVIGNTEGCYLTSFDTKDVAEKIERALKFAEEKGRTKGRERIIKLGLDTETIASRIVEVYEEVLKGK